MESELDQVIQGEPGSLAEVGAYLLFDLGFQLVSLDLLRGGEQLVALLRGQQGCFLDELLSLYRAYVAFGVAVLDRIVLDLGNAQFLRWRWGGCFGHLERFFSP